MTPGAAKRKGSRYERLTAVRLSRWVSRGKSTSLFWRSSISGGRATANYRASGVVMPEQCGDIISVSPEGMLISRMFHIECKCRKSLELNKLVFGQKSSLALEFWVNTRAAARMFEKIPLLIMKERWQQDLVIADKAGYIALRAAGSIPLLLTIPRFGGYLFTLREMLLTDYKKFRRIHEATQRETLRDDR